MDFKLLNLLIILVISAFMAGILIPKILLISFRKKLFDVPDERKIHTSLVPRLGGLAFSPVIFLSIVFLIGMNNFLGHADFMGDIVNNGIEFAFEFCSMMLLYLVGIADDLIGVRYRAKFITQIVCGALLIMGGVYIDNLYGMFWLNDLNMIFGWALTVFAVVFITNAINLIDGVDGLASGLSIATTITFGIAFYYLGEYVYAMISFATLGVLIPFFYYNVFGKAENRQKIFMGDTGSLTLGFILSFLSIKLLMLQGDTPIEGEFNPFVVAFSPLLVPCLDIVRVFLLRARNKKNPFKPDKNHIHHKLLALGVSQPVTMLTVVCSSIVLTVLNILFSYYISVTLLFVCDVVLWTAVNYWLRILIIRKNKCELTDK